MPCGRHLRGECEVSMRRRGKVERTSRIENAAPIDIPDRMSYDLHIFFPHAEFPAPPWYELLGSFRDRDCEVAFDSLEPGERGGVKNCSLVVGQSVLSIGVGAGSSSCAPTGTRWEANL